MIRRIHLIFTAAGAITGAITGVFLSDMSPPVAEGATKSVVVPLSVAGAVGTKGGASPIVEVSVGTAKPVPVILDTGSAGLHIFDDAVDGTAGGGVNVTSRSSNITYAGGHRFTGVVASAVVAIGSQATAGPVAFSLVKSASCIASKPTCKAAGGIAGFEAKTGAHGILGIGMQRSRGPVTSPILAMPGALERAPAWRCRDARSRCTGSFERHDRGHLQDELARPHRASHSLERLSLAVVHDDR
jgi:hypothetical protein